MTITKTLLLAAAGVALAACARDLPKDTQAYVKGVQRSASYHRGYVDGCETADYSHGRQKMSRDETAFQDNPNYRLGWVAGTENCHDTVFTPSTGDPNKGHTSGIF